MSMTPDEVLAQMPGWEDAQLTELSGGLTNQTWRVTAEHKTGVLKIDEGERQAPFNSRRDEAIVQSSAARADLAPKVLHADIGVYFTEYVEGNVWTRGDLDVAGNLERVAATLKRVHSLQLTGRTFDATIAAKRYAKNITNQDPAVVQRCTDIVASMRLPQNLCCCHNDLVAANVISTPSLMFLDWEYACDNDPFFDLATVAEHHELSAAQVTTLLDAYFDGNGQRWSAQLEKQRKLYLALLFLWMAARSDSAPEELQRVVQRLSTSYS
jgi:thiamine kinase-like enzyme